MSDMGQYSRHPSGARGTGAPPSNATPPPDAAPSPDAAPPVQGRSQGSPRRTSTARLRTAEQVWRGNPPDLPFDFPAGPFASMSMHMDRIKSYASSPDVGGGIWFVREKESKPEGSRRGPRVRLVCSREGHARRQEGSTGEATIPAAEGVQRPDRRKRGSQRCGCPWSVSLELVAGPDECEQYAPLHPSLNSSPFAFKSHCCAAMRTQVYCRFCKAGSQSHSSHQRTFKLAFSDSACYSI